jgi:hypothetical protein
LTPTQRLAINKKRELLQSRIDAFQAKAYNFMGDLDDLQSEATDDGAEWDDITDEDIGRAGERRHQLERVFSPERSSLKLPSTVGQQWCKDNGFKDLIKKELNLRMGQANDALHALRVALGAKSFLFRTTIRQAKSQATKTRGWDTIKAVESSSQQHARVYSRARQAMILLGAKKDLLIKYQVLHREQLKVSTGLLDPSLPGQRNLSLPWFWNLENNDRTSSSSWMLECEQIHETLLQRC